jgi:hypothetical protein
MAQLTLGIEKNREAQKTLDAARKAGKVNDGDYAQQSVKLREELKGQRTSMRELEKGLATSQQAYTSAAGSIDQLKARSAELTTAYNAMGKEERTATEAGQLLTAELLEVNKALASHLTPSLQNMVTSLPAPSLNLTELRERNNQLDRVASQTNI